MKKIADDQALDVVVLGKEGLERAGLVHRSQRRIEARLHEELLIAGQGAAAGKIPRSSGTRAANALLGVEREWDSVPSDEFETAQGEHWILLELLGTLK